MVPSRSVVLEIEGRLVNGSFTASGDCWHLRWPGGEATFSPSSHPGRGLIGDQALKRFLAEELAPRGILPRICGTCARFVFSGMSWDMSGGWVGYCVYAREEPLDPRRDITGIWDGCAHWTAKTSDR